MTAGGTDVRVALVGCGRISQNHFDAIAAVDGLRLSAVCDVMPERARQAGERFGVPSFTAYETMLREAECDVRFRGKGRADLDQLGKCGEAITEHINVIHPKWEAFHDEDALQVRL